MIYETCNKRSLDKMSEIMVLEVLDLYTRKHKKAPTVKELWAFLIDLGEGKIELGKGEKVPIGIRTWVAIKRRMYKVTKNRVDSSFYRWVRKLENELVINCIGKPKKIELTPLGKWVYDGDIDTNLEHASGVICKSCNKKEDIVNGTKVIVGHIDEKTIWISKRGNLYATAICPKCGGQHIVYISTKWEKGEFHPRFDKGSFLRYHRERVKTLGKYFQKVITR